MLRASARALRSRANSSSCCAMVAPTVSRMRSLSSVHAMARSSFRQGGRSCSPPMTSTVGTSQRRSATTG